MSRIGRMWVGVGVGVINGGVMLVHRFGSGHWMAASDNGMMRSGQPYISDVMGESHLGWD